MHLKSNSFLRCKEQKVYEFNCLFSYTFTKLLLLQNEWATHQSVCRCGYTRNGQIRSVWCFVHQPSCYRLSQSDYFKCIIWIRRGEIVMKYASKENSFVQQFFLDWWCELCDIEIGLSFSQLRATTISCKVFWQMTRMYQIHKTC